MLFFVRTIFLGYKYFFFASVLPLIYICYNKTAKIKWHVTRNQFLSFISAILVVVIFCCNFSKRPLLIKEFINLFVTIFLLFLFEPHKHGAVFFKQIMLFVDIAGVIAITRSILSLVGVDIPYPKFLFESDSFPLTLDNNFYSLYFLLTIPISIYLLSIQKIPERIFVINTVVSSINILFSASRRGYILYGIMIIYYLLLIAFEKKKIIKMYKYMVLSTIACIVIATAIALHHYNVNRSSLNTSSPLFWKYYKVYTFFSPETSLPTFQNKLTYGKVDWENEIHDCNNLFYNSDFYDDLKYWSSIQSNNDDISMNVITDSVNSRFIRINRNSGNGFWQLYYIGRPIYYHKNLTYSISFKYRIIKGGGLPFSVGWEIEEDGKFIRNTPATVTLDQSGWYSYFTSHEFAENQSNAICFLNSLQPQTIVDIKDIKMECNDTIGLPMFIDELTFKKSASSKNNFIAPRADRWRYAWELWQTKYNWKQKLFGHGFDYLEWYGEKFYNNPKRYDFPHNPIISAFLYSGIIGGVVYIWFLAMSLWLYWKKRSDLGIFFIMYLCCMFFCMFSGSSHFSFPLFVFLSLLPFVEQRKISDSEAFKTNSIEA